MNELTSREIELLKLFALSNTQIAQRLNIEPSTVKKHVHNVIQKLYCKSRGQALVNAVKSGIIKVEEIVS